MNAKEFKEKKAKDFERAREVYAELLGEFSHLPFLFLGAGISRRYMGLPNWEGLLRHFAEQVYPDNPLALEVFSQSEEGLDWPEVATRLEKAFNQAWLTEKRFAKSRETYQEQVKKGTSPFKLSLAHFFRNAEKLKEHTYLQNELSLLVNVGKRSVAGVITTNYDLLPEELFGGYEVFVGQEQLLFSEPQGVAEIYKIHGCCTQPDSLVINTRDYEAFNQRNAYLAAKLLTVFVEHPIIFMGYSISDPNVQEILKAISGCLSQENLSRLQRRFIFVEYSPEPLDVPEVRGHTVNFGDSGRSLEMTRILLHDYHPFYSELMAHKYAYNPKLLRQLKRDIYKLVTTNEPVERFKVVDIEDDAELANVSVLAGVGVGGNPGINGDSGHHIPATDVLFRDIVFDDGDFDLKSLVEEALGHLLKHNSYSLPLYKYISAYKAEFGEDAPPDVLNSAKTSIEEFLSKGLKTRRANHPVASFEELRKLADTDEKMIEMMPLLIELESCLNEMGEFLTDYIKKNPTALTGPAQGLKTNLKRVIKIYDWLKYGKEKGVPTT
jgi:hypothetical protein